MAFRVVDSSALAAVVFSEPQGQVIAPRLEGLPLVAPNLLPYEMANICLTKMRKHPAARDALFIAYQLSFRMGIDLAEVDMEEVLDLADATRLTAYDASYLWLAHKLGAELVTLDKRLSTAAASISAR